MAASEGTTEAPGTLTAHRRTGPPPRLRGGWFLVRGEIEKRRPTQPSGGTPEQGAASLQRLLTGADMCDLRTPATPSDQPSPSLTRVAANRCVSCRNGLLNLLRRNDTSLRVEAFPWLRRTTGTILNHRARALGSARLRGPRLGHVAPPPLRSCGCGRRLRARRLRALSPDRRALAPSSRSRRRGRPAFCSFAA